MTSFALAFLLRICYKIMVLSVLLFVAAIIQLYLLPSMYCMSGNTQKSCWYNDLAFCRVMQNHLLTSGKVFDLAPGFKFSFSQMHYESLNCNGYVTIL